MARWQVPGSGASDGACVMGLNDLTSDRCGLWQVTGVVCGMSVTYGVWCGMWRGVRCTEGEPARFSSSHQEAEVGMGWIGV